MEPLRYIQTLEGHPMFLNQEYYTRDGTVVKFLAVQEDLGCYVVTWFKNNSLTPLLNNWDFNGRYSGVGYDHELDIMRPKDIKKVTANLSDVEDITSAFRFMQQREKELCTTQAEMRV